jgi:hypothetical protein
MAIDMKSSGELGCCYANPMDCRLYLLETVRYADADVMGSLMAYIQPTTILIHGKTTKVLVDFVERRANSVADGEYSVP